MILAGWNQFESFKTFRGTYSTKKVIGRLLYSEHKAEKLSALFSGFNQEITTKISMNEL